MMQLGVIIPGDAEGGGSSDAAPGTAPPPLEESGGAGGNRWPRQETLALLKIRSDMDVTFKDASLKGPLWEEVSRKMGELGFQRSPKKCKEKFENVYKYHKRTKDGRASKPDGKNYRFFDQLAALETTPLSHSFSPPPPPPLTVSSTTSPTPLSVAPPTTRINSSPPFQPPPLPPQQHLHHHPVATSPVSNSTSSSTSSDEDIQRRRGRKRKWKDYFERLMKDVVEKQEELQKKFLEALEKRERDRIAREEAWRVQEMARLNREHDRLVQERSAAAAKDAAVIAFLQKVTGEHSINLHNPASNTSPQPPPMQVVQQLEISQPTPPPPQQTTLPPTPTPSSQPMIPPTPKPTELVVSNRDNVSAASSRWPKAEVEALIKLRTGLELKYQDNGPKGPLWEEISKSMAKLGYNRNSKRCKEKWENINKYFKKVKEGSKKRPEDSKTCPYFHQLDAIYKERAKSHVAASLYSMKPEAPIMARPEQQWPQPEQQVQALHENDSTEKNEEDDDYEDDDDVGEYEIITNKQPSSVLTNTVD